ncbi:hypothetical protein [Pedobacter frigidisoli]|nr:hypothetical protein [Pedobacter frigidisoli]
MNYPQTSPNFSKRIPTTALIDAIKATEVMIKQVFAELTEDMLAKEYP